MDFKSFFIKGKLGLKRKTSDVRELTLFDAKNLFFRSLRRLPDVMHLRELVLFTIVFSFVILILFWQRFSNLEDYYVKNEADVGGIYVEGLVGNIKSFNPIYEGLNPAEDDVNKLIYAGLTKKDNKKGIVPDLAESWEVQSDGKVYIFHLKDGIKWHDGVEFEAGDVVYTVQAIQDPDARSSLFSTWSGVVAEEIDRQTVRFTLPDVYNSFLLNTDFGVLPRHLYEKVPGRNLKVAEFNTKPVGTGPYRFEKLEEKKTTSQIYLVANRDKKDREPYIEKVRFRTYPDQSLLIEGYAKREIMGDSRVLASDLVEVKKLKNITFYETQLPRYTAVFYNQKSELFKDKGVRTAFSKSINKGEILDLFDQEKAIDIDSPILPGFVGHLKDIAPPVYDTKGANDVLDGAGWVKDGEIRKKDGKELIVNFVTSDSAEHKRVAEYLKTKWEKDLGVKVELKTLGAQELQDDHIKPRAYDALLFGVNLGGDSDLYSFWHSSQRDEPGLNLAYFGDSKVDKYLEIARETTDQTRSKEMLEKAQNVIIGEVPASFLYNPTYIYGLSKEVKGVNIGKITKPSERFNNISDWYIEEKRSK